jgi:hypothetical protein
MYGLLVSLQGSRIKVRLLITFDEPRHTPPLSMVWHDHVNDFWQKL